MKKTILALLAVTGLIAAQAYAFTGDIEFGGSASASSSGGTTTVHFATNWSVIADDGAYSGVPVGTPASFFDVSYTGNGMSAVLTAPVTPQWSFTFGGDTYTFDLTNLTNAVVTSSAMNLAGNGTAFINGGQATSATWALQGTGSGFKFKFSSSTTTVVPDGGSAVALLGIALAGIEGTRRLIRRKA